LQSNNIVTCTVCNTLGSFDDYYVRHGSVELTADEKSQVLQQLPTGVSHTEVDAVLAVLGQILTGSTAANEEDIGEQDQVCGFCLQYTTCCRCQFGILTHTHIHTTILRPFSWTTRVSWCKKRSSSGLLWWLYRRFPDNHFPGQTFPRQVVSQTRPFTDNHFPWQTFPGQVMLRNFDVHNVCKYQLCWPSHTIYRYTEHLMMCSQHCPRTVKKIIHSVHQLTSPHKHTDFMNATAISLSFDQ